MYKKFQKKGGLIMEKLQNDYTTPEQSKRLLELGVPADSANLFHECFLIGGEKYYGKPELIKESDTFSGCKKLLEDYSTIIIPCWSAGRLIEIFELCTGVLWQDTAQPSVKQPTLIERVIDTIVLFNRHVPMNFSKLEE